MLVSIQGCSSEMGVIPTHTIDCTRIFSALVLYNVLLINWYIGNITIKCHSKSMGDNRDPTVVLHQEISTLPVSIASDTRCF